MTIRDDSPDLVGLCPAPRVIYSLWSPDEEEPLLGIWERDALEGMRWLIRKVRGVYPHKRLTLLRQHPSGWAVRVVPPS